MTKIFLDTEFTGLHQRTTLISIGLAAETGEEFYAELTDYDPLQLNEWLEKEVLPKLWLANGQNFERKENGVYLRGDSTDVKLALEKWLGQFEGVEIWADVLAYDWVLFCELFGGALGIPENIFYAPFDLATLFRMRGYIIPESKYAKDTDRMEFAGMNGNVRHNALKDAQAERDCWEKIMRE